MELDPRIKVGMDLPAIQAATNSSLSKAEDEAP
jgi:hypothetical protein